MVGDCGEVGVGWSRVDAGFVNQNGFVCGGVGYCLLVVEALELICF